MRRSMYLLVALLAAVKLCALSATPQPSYRESPPYHATLPFGQSLAVSDFDGDDHLDRAKLSGPGLSKRIEIYFSRTHRLSVLQFDTETVEHGSLFAQDINDDGDADLIWTDLFHPNNVIVWIGDGLGQFERICSREYAQQFVIGSSLGVATPSDQNPEIAAGPARDSSSDQGLTQGWDFHITTNLLKQEPEQLLTLSSYAEPITVRGPPRFLC